SKRKIHFEPLRYLIFKVLARSFGELFNYTLLFAVCQHLFLKNLKYFLSFFKVPPQDAQRCLYYHAFHRLSTPFLKFF
ncbi:MAG: hypothetical protein IKA17_06980, partial [Clostridia bacterium]|nr:hypothetical protein [Clostridia bacterium]